MARQDLVYECEEDDCDEVIAERNVLRKEVARLRGLLQRVKTEMEEHCDHGDLYHEIKYEVDGD
jgi:hypothetical protein